MLMLPSRRRSGIRSVPTGASLPKTEACSTRRTSRVAVRPMRSFARATSCTPGNCTTMRSAPCCWMTGSATASSLMRLFRVTMFCFSASSWKVLIACGVRVTTRVKSAPVRVSVSSSSGWPLAMTCFALSRISASRNWTCTTWPLRAIPACRMFLSRSRVRRSAATESRRLLSALFMSTCNRKCTPPRKSRPRYIGRALMLVSQLGEFDKRLSATL